jgi:hypothetical protein
MASRPARPRREGPLDSVRGRTDDPADLRQRLKTAPLSYLQGAIENPSLSEEEVVLLLKNRSAASVLVRVGRDRRWTKSYEVKKALVHHPKTPATLARSFLPHLYWKDLADAAEDPRVPPAVRKQAEEVLKRRLEELTQGERITLARRASRGVIGALAESSEPRVLKALLGNVRMMEHDALRIASNALAPRDVLRVLADHPAWGLRYTVRLSLIRNSRTPVPVALRLMEGLPHQDLLQLSRDGSVPKIVRVGADRRLGDRALPARSGRRG